VADVVAIGGGMEKSILLINAKTRGLCRPSGLEYLAEAASNANIPVKILDLATEENPEQAVRTAIEHEKYGAVGISIFNTQWDTGRDQVKFFLPEIRSMISDIRRFTEVPVVLGGYGFSLQPKDILEYVGGDYGVAGCGIPSFIELLRGIRSSAERPGSIVADETSPYLDFAPKRRLVNENNYSKQEEVFVSTKIGCIEKCFHCPTLAVKFRLREPQYVVEEVRNLLEQGIERISFMHDTFNVPVKHAYAICEGISGLPIRWSAYIYPVQEFLPPELLEIMKKSGMVRADIGGRMIGSEAMLKAYGVGFSKKDIECATELFKAKGIETYWFLGFGAPGENRDTIDETFDFIDQVRPDRVGMFTRTRVYRHSPLGERCVNEGIVRAQDRLLEPTYYPFSDELRDYIFELAEGRKNCNVYY
jgi:radical SAM superfamily enzyme YgiQ (UPF0313 family)